VLVGYYTLLHMWGTTLRKAVLFAKSEFMRLYLP